MGRNAGISNTLRWTNMNISAFSLQQSKLAVLAAAVAIALAGTGGAQAQDSPRENANRPPTSQSTQVARSDTGLQTLDKHLQSNTLRMSKLVGMELQNRSGDNLGEVHDVLRGAAPGQKMQLIVSTGGIGADDKLIAVPFDEVQVNAKGDELYTMQTRDQLASSPPVTLEARPDGAAANRGAAPAAGAARTPAGLAERRIGDLVGAEVVGSGGESVGEVEDIIISTAGADSVRAVLQVGGVAGIGEKRISLPLAQLATERTGSDSEPMLRVSLDKAALERLPEFEYDEHTEAL
jgi:sporulation protein YlmC with PRC-barrel domain